MSGAARRLLDSAPCDADASIRVMTTGDSGTRRFAGEAMSENELSRAASPYLLQHADNPVHWRMWSPQALEDAQTLGKPILLSIGYAACHWCHVMAHESFEDADTAAVMNALFVNIKVDREERPDIDHIYMSALQALGQRGGWPLTMFLTPTGDAFWGGTYYPKTDQYGRPGFVGVMKRVAQVFSGEPASVAQNVAAIRETMSRAVDRDAESGGPFDLAQLDTLAAQLMRAVDTDHGGLRGAPKFPNTPLFEFLWRAGARRPDTPCRDLALLTLRRMSQGGIYDHLGGGYARYSTDERWLAPHFEKMLYDNAQILEMLALCHAHTGDPLFAARARETVGFLLRDMTSAEGAFCASLDADSDGVEGKFYVWTYDELERALGANDAAFLGRFYDAAPGGNWFEEHYPASVIILNRLNSPPATPPEEEKLAALREKLFALRAQRIPPGRDDKIMADWNGLMIAALVNAATLLGEPAWIGAAARAYAFIATTLRYEDADGATRLAHSWRAGVFVRPGLALDYAAMMRAALALHEARHLSPAPRRDYLGDAIAFAQALDAHHLDPASGLLRMAADDAADVVMHLSPTTDDAIPNAHSVFLSALVRLAAQSGDDASLARADALFAALEPVMRGNVFGHAAALNALDLRLRAKTIVTAGDKRRPLYEAALAAPFIDRIVVDIDGAETAAGNVAAAQLQTAGEAAAFVCFGGACSAPARTLAELKERLAQ